ncbi:hypothetical protein ACFP1Z_14175 [Streptomyces gamaensis]|uniref:Hydrogenase expression protein HypF n=1 Tax=Streptomyces gamaensis TaxID=1763542 RepID=A0ABW0Z407_9ACTN
MPTDEARPAHDERPATGHGSGERVRPGPRHAAPRKPLLDRLHMPAGKAVALAAMPTAVLMGMGFTPQLALAKPVPANPFRGASCAPAPETAASTGTARTGARTGVGPHPDASPRPAATPSASAARTTPSAPQATPSPAAPAPSSAPSVPAHPGEEDKPAYPCPVPDPRALAAAQPDDSHVLPDNPWYLEASVLTLNGLDYEGIKKVRTASGQEKPVLKFTATALDIKDMHQIVNSRGKEYHITGNGPTPTLRGGKVTLYTEELKGNLFGVIPVSFSPSSPPPLTLPFLVFTDVKIRQAGQYGGTLTVPRLHLYLTDGTYP